MEFIFEIPKRTEMFVTLRKKFVEVLAQQAKAETCKSMLHPYVSKNTDKEPSPPGVPVNLWISVVVPTPIAATKGPFESAWREIYKPN